MGALRLRPVGPSAQSEEIDAGKLNKRGVEKCTFRTALDGQKSCEDGTATSALLAHC